MNHEEWVKAVVEKSGAAIANSSVYCSLFTEDFKKNPQCALELGLALLMNKPIILVVQEGVTIPDRLRKIADAIEYYRGLDDAGLATQRAVKAVIKDG